MSENKNAKTPADNGKPVAWITRGKLTMIRADAVMLDDTSIPLYVSPRKQWVGLKDEEIVAATNAVHGFGAIKQKDMNFAKAIEAKLKERNT